MTKEEVVEFLNKEENKTFLSENGFQTEKIVEKVVEKPAQLTDEAVSEYILKNPKVSKPFETAGVKAFLKEKLGKDVTDDMLKGGFVESTVLETVKKNVVSEMFKGNPYADLLTSKVDLTKIEINGEGIKGLTDQMDALKVSYPALFGAPTAPVNTPPGNPNKSTSDAEVAKIDSQIKELEKSNTIQNRAKIGLLLSQKQQLLNKKGE